MRDERVVVGVRVGWSGGGGEEMLAMDVRMSSSVVVDSMQDGWTHWFRRARQLSTTLLRSLLPPRLSVLKRKVGKNHEDVRRTDQILYAKS
jgi:hypothetical protein